MALDRLARRNFLIFTITPRASNQATFGYGTKFPFHEVRKPVSRRKASAGKKG
jgi:hypothetical protein